MTNSAYKDSERIPNSMLYSLAVAAKGTYLTATFANWIAS